MKTTVEIADDLLRQAKDAAHRQETTLRALIEQGLRLVLAREGPPREPYRLEDCSFGGQGLQPEFQNATWAEILDATYDWKRWT